MTLGVTDVPLFTDGLSLGAGVFIREGSYVAVAGASQVSFRGKCISEPSGLLAVEITADA